MNSVRDTPIFDGEDMESGEQLASLPSAPSSSSASSSPAPSQTPSTKCSSALSSAGNSPLTTGSHLKTGNDSLSTSGSSNPFSVVSGPAFGCYISSSGRSDFGGLGGLGLSAALAAHSQFGTFPDWWRAPEVHTRGAAAFFPHLLGGIPVFTPNLQSRTSGINGALNGRNTGSSTRNYAVNPSPFIAEGNKEKSKATDNINRSQKSSKGLVQLQQRTKEKKPSKRLLEAASMSGSQSGSLSDSSSDYEESSSDPDDLEEEEDDDEDEDDQSNESELSDSEKEIRRKRMRLTQNTSDTKKKRPCTADDNTTRDSETFLAQHQHHGVPLTSSHRLQASSHPAGLPQSTALFLRSPSTTDEESQQHISVIQAVGLAVASSPIGQSQRGASPLPSRSSPKQLPPSASPKPFSHCSSPKPLALCSPSNKPLCLSPSPKPSLLSTPKPPLHALLAKPPGLLASQKPPDKPRLSPSPKHTHQAGGINESKGKPPLETSFCVNSAQKESLSTMDSSLRPKTQDRIKSHKNSASSPSPLSSPPFSSLSRHLLSSQHSNEPSLFLNYHTNGALSSAVQDAPLALITKPRGQSSTPSSKPLLAGTSTPLPMPVNLSTGTKEPSSSSTSPLKNSASPGPAHRPRKSMKSLCTAKNLTQPNLFCSRDSVGENQSEIHNSKDSDDSLGDDDDDDDGDDIEDSGSSLSESESNLESNSDGTDNDSKQRGETEADSDAERTPQKLAKASSSAHKSSSSLSANCSALNLKVFKPSCLPSSFVTPTAITSLEALSNRSTTGSFTFASVPESGKRRRVTDEKVLRLPLEFGWQRETRIRTVAGRLQGEVSYFAPCGKKLRQYPDVMKYLLRNGINEISRDNFSFSTKMNLGDFYEAREGPEGLQWVLLADEEITSRIIAMDGRRSRRTKLERQPIVDGAEAKQWRGHHPTVVESNFQDVSDAKLLRKLEAQEIARQAAQIKMMRKLEKQAMAQAAKEARKQQAIMAAEERRKKKEQMKILKQQEKIKRIQQIRMEKELRAQQILEAKRRKKEAAANAKILEAEKRSKEREMRRLHAVILKHQELEKHRLDMERERRRQHMMLMKAVEARKKAEEKERLRKEKKDEKRLNKERKLELRRLELEKAKELKKPNEDMCLADHKPLPELSRIPGLVLSGSTFSDCLMVLQFLHSFGKVLDLNINSESLTLSDLQEGLLSFGESMGKVQDLLVCMVSAAVCDPGIPQGHKNKTALGEHLTNVEINRDNVSEILQIYMESHSEQSELAALALSLRTKAFQAHTPSQKAFMLAFLVNELCCSKAVISEIDKNIDHMTNLRKDKWVVEGKLRKLRSIHAKKTGKRDSTVGEDNHTFSLPAVRNNCKRKEGDSEEEEDDDEDSEDQGEDEAEEEEETGGKKGKKADIFDEEDDSALSASIEELEKQIEKTYKQQNQIRQKLLDSSHSLRSMMIGQDRYKRRYWVLPEGTGIFVEGMESGEGYEEMERERKRQRTAQVSKVKEEQLDDTKEPLVSSPAQSTDGDTAPSECQQDKDSLNLFLQKPGSFSKLSKLLEVAKMAQDPVINSLNSQSVHPAKIPTSASYHLSSSSQSLQPGKSQSLQPATSHLGMTDKTDASSLPSPPQPQSTSWMTSSPQSLPHNDQLSKTLVEKSNQWFSLLPRSPCYESSVTSGSSPPAASSSFLQTIGTKSPSCLSPNPSAAAGSNTPATINNMQLSAQQSVKSGIQVKLTCDVSSAATNPSLPFSGSSLPPMENLASQHAEGNENRVVYLASNNSDSKTEPPEPQNDKPTCASFPAVDVAKTQDYPCPQPIPEEMLHGWWQMSDTEELHSLIKALNSRGIREKFLQKQIQKHMEYMTQLCNNHKDAIDVSELQEYGVSEETVRSWCVEDQAMEVDISLLQQVEALERKVISASLQVKGWMHPEPQSQWEDLAYHEHKPFFPPALENEGQRKSSHEKPPGAVVRRPNNPLDIAVTRLAELEKNIERRSEEDVVPGMKLWHKALAEVRSSAQLSLCIQQLQKSIAWERAIMKVQCQLCQKGDNEEMLLLCDGCDKGCHMYCHKPRITAVPDGDWFCPACVMKESGQSLRTRKQPSQTAGGGRKGSEVKRNSKPSVAEELIKEEAASSSTPKKATKELKKRKGEPSQASTQAKHDGPVSCAKKAKTAKDSNTNELAMCRTLLAELEAHPAAWPFLSPVNQKSVPGYRKIIKKPMDFSTIREKLSNNQYLNLESFIMDVNLVFDNCEKFNEDHSEIGQAGHSMRRYFDKRWTELLK